ncbi:hypothetical protein MSAN_01577100 [Mycena sanguinolenta]|uniref:Uncharacterized protein n=1 Tax=Mycena sanguinolenta TaxID=230812 RepID=A0A8H6XZY5_9AGAR|nr:hypothetical protein MSAN_01577100 [Mycena sanguinolenta]
MSLPQELINAIIDAVVSDLDLAQDPWIVDNTPEVLDTLKSCALVARAFVCPCQIYIFHGITISDDAHLPPLVFSTLLMESPHLASHIRAIYFEYSVGAEPENVEPMKHILASATNLERLDIYPEAPSQSVVWSQYPEPVRTAFASAFALPYLRHITLWYSHFNDASELQLLLRESFSLKTLVLRSLTFGSTEEAEIPEAPSPPPRCELLHSFTAIDITRLRTLYLHNSPMNTLLRVNAPTIQELRIRAYYPEALLDASVDADALSAAHNLQTLDLKVPFLSTLNKMLRMLGTLSQLTRLRSISVMVSQRTLQADWEELDGLLGVVGDLPALEEVNVFSGSQFEEPHPEALLRTWMPALTGRNVLRIHGKAVYP